MAKTPLRAVRLDDEIWDAAKRKAADQGINLSELIRAQLTAWVDPTMTTLFDQMPSLASFRDGLPAALQAALRDYLTDGELDRRVERLNTVREFIADYSPFSKEPVDFVEWVPCDAVRANDYNPNTVAPPEMELLRHSILADGYTQPIVTMPDDDGRVVIDGFHRHRVGKELPDVHARIHGYLPTVRIRNDREGRNDRIAATIRHNRARGKHRVDAMSEIVVELKRRNWTEERIGKELGMEPDEVLRLCQMSGLAELFSDDEFSASWDAIGSDDAFTGLDDTEVLAGSDDPARIYHTWDEWECFDAGFYLNHHPDRSDAECVDLCIGLLTDPDRLSEALDGVISEWSLSCEHYLSNERMDRITWLKQAACCYAFGVPNQVFSDKVLTPAQREVADTAALERLNAWLTQHDRPALATLADAARKTQPELY